MEVLVGICLFLVTLFVGIVSIYIVIIVAALLWILLEATRDFIYDWLVFEGLKPRYFGVRHFLTAVAVCLLTLVVYDQFRLRSHPITFQATGYDDNAVGYRVWVYAVPSGNYLWVGVSYTSYSVPGVRVMPPEEHHRTLYDHAGIPAAEAGLPKKLYFYRRE